MGRGHRQGVESEAQGRDLAAVLRALADHAELAEPANEFGILKEGLPPLFDALAGIGHPAPYEELKVVTRQLLEGAFESSILGLIPDDATVSGVRVGTDRVCAQIALVGRPAHVSEIAQTLALGWFAAFARSLADLLDERA